MRALLVLCCLLAFSAGLYTAPAQPMSYTGERVVISGEVLEIGPPPGVNDRFPFQLLKYRVLAVCEGNYEGKEVLVYHMVKPEGLEDLKVGDKVCLGIDKSLVMDDAKAWIEEEPKKGEEAPNELATDYIALDIFIRRCQCSSE